MKISTRTWVILLFVLILAAAVVLYFMYNNKLEEREQAVNSRNQAELMIPVLQSQKASAEEELTGLKTQYQELLKELENLNTSLGESEDELAGSQARLRLVIESIEYGKGCLYWHMPVEWR
jgi:peptidoglycan hydrolase CwlO-like protein